MEETTFNHIINDTIELLKRRSSSSKDSTISLSPEVAAKLESLPGSGGGSPMKSAPDSEKFARLAKEVSVCRKCPLCEGRTNTVFGTGSAQAGLVFVGEAPGAEEDRQGVPFVGKAGQLLTDIIEKGMKLRRDDVYICNVLKCRPPANRDPLPAEIAECEHYLVGQLELIQPRVICALGRFAAQTLLRSTESLTRLRGRWHWYRGIPLRATYHPAYLLRQHGERLREDKRKCWMDVLEVVKVYHGEIVPE